MRKWTISRIAGGLVIAGVLFVTILAPVGAATAQPGPAGQGHCDRPEGLLTPEDRQVIGDRMMQRIQDKLGLSQEQANEIRAVLQSRREQLRDELRQLCEARAELRQLLSRQDADPTTVKAVSEKIKVRQGTMLDQRVDTYLALRSKLTPEQWQKWLDLRQHVGRRFRGHGPGA
jgi:Spy/CpxP family protein refolding chaperone